MIIDKLLTVARQKNDDSRPLYLRTLLKDAIQDFVLNFIYNDAEYKNLIFTGGTALRKIYGLPRFSEDLDFDFLDAVNLKHLAVKISTYFLENLKFPDLQTKIANNGQSIFLKFPVLKQLGLVKNASDPLVLFVRCDLAEQSGVFQTEISSLSTPEYSFFIKSYDLPTLFANKIMAFLQRVYFKGGAQAESFKGRDIYDLMWLLEKSAKIDFALQPNWQRLFEKLKTDSKEKILAMILTKLKKIDPREVELDLLPFIPEITTIHGFAQNFPQIIENKGKLLFADKKS